MTTTDGFALSFGRDLQDNQCHAEDCGPRDHAELAAVLMVSRAGSDPWATLSTFSTLLRRAEDWVSADGALLDFDWTDPALPAGEGHLPVPEAIAARLLDAARGGLLPSGILYPTRRGFRFGVLFRKPVRDADTYTQAVEELGRLVLDALDDDDFSVARSGVVGFAFDEASTKVAQVQRLPRDGAPIVVTGETVYNAVMLARGEIRPEMPLEAALPCDIAAAARQIGAWVQIAPEVVVVHILATISATVGNTRRVQCRGLEHNLSLQFLTLVKSGAGKTTVRKCLDPATAAMRRAVQERRDAAQKEWELYEIQLKGWKSALSSRKKRAEPVGPRPEPPALRLRETFMLTEATTEALYKALTDTPRGILWSTSEAHEILGALGRYSDGGKGRDLDTARLRKLTEGEDTEIHRSVDGIRTITAPFVAIDMDAQPAIRDSLFQEIDKVSGFSARFLIHEPTSLLGVRRYVHRPQSPDALLLEQIGETLAGLWAKKLDVGQDGRVQPVPLYVSDEADQLWAVELEHLERRLPGAAADEEGFFGHLRGRLLRLAGVLALWEDPTACMIDGETMRRAILLGRYFLRHHRAAARAAREAQQERAVEAIRERVELKGSICPRDAAGQWRRYRGPDGAALAIAHFRAAGLVPQKQGKTAGPGRPKHDRWVFPNRPSKPSKSAPDEGQTDTDGFDGEGPSSNGNAPTDWDGRFAALNQSLAGTVEHPPGGKGACPLCKHADCFGRVNDSNYWKCFSSDHAAVCGGQSDHGDLLDLWFLRGQGRLPTKDERVQQLLAFESGGTP